MEVATLKLRQLKRKHVGRLRLRIVMARMAALRIEWDRALDDMAGAMAKAILGYGEAIKQRLLLVFNKTGDLVAHSDTACQPDTPMTMGLIPANTQIKGHIASAPLEMHDR
jgi:hypothetical protein